MKIVQLVPSFSALSGGLFISISNLVKSSFKEGVDVIVCGPEGRESAQELAQWRPASVQRYWRVGPKTFGYSPRLLTNLHTLSPDLIHSHGLWTFTSVAAALWSNGSDRPYIVSIHGMLESWSLKQSPLKKAIARKLYQDKVIQGAACIRATSSMEMKSIRDAGFTNPIALVPNGVNPPPHPATPLRSPKRLLRQALFLSRLHPKKGLVELIEAWRRLRPKGWSLSIVGPNEGGYQRTIETVIRDAGLSDTVSIQGAVWGDKRFECYWQSDLFVLPSFSENFGLVVAEALACELPVITTKGLPWEEIKEFDCGWWIEVGVDPLVEALQEAINTSDERRGAMGKRGRQLISTRYSWTSAASRMQDVYRWVLGQGERPRYVDT